MEDWYAFNTTLESSLLKTRNILSIKILNMQTNSMVFCCKRAVTSLTELMAPKCWQIVSKYERWKDSVLITGFKSLNQIIVQSCQLVLGSGKNNANWQSRTICICSNLVFLELQS